MALSSLMVSLGTPAPDFTLDDLSGTKVRLDDFAAAPALLVAFLCNHCPYVRHIEAELGRVVARYPNLAACAFAPTIRRHILTIGPTTADQARRASTFPTCYTSTPLPGLSASTLDSTHTRRKGFQHE